jgi:uncharacterized DUF497 family protein
MEFEWDDAKGHNCLEKRGFDFAFASRLWERRVIERQDNRHDYGEIRIQALGTIETQYFVVVFTCADPLGVLSRRAGQMKEI